VSSTVCKGFTNRPGDGSDGESDGDPITIEAAVKLDTDGSTNRLVGSSDVLPNPTKITIGTSVYVVDTDGSTKHLVGSSDMLPNPTKITIGASVDVVDTEGPVPSCAKVTSILPFYDASTFCLEGNFSKGP
jgi:hypothetical protein